MTLLLTAAGIAHADTAPGERIQVNQVGFHPAAPKVAVVETGSARPFTVVDSESGEAVFSGETTESAQWPFSSGDVALADFSGLRAPGRYRVEVEGIGASHAFNIGDAVYAALSDAATKAYYYNRASTALPEAFAGRWARAAGHPDTQVMIHASAASAERPSGSVIASPRGWYDAGDYGKYIVNSGISTYTLLAALERDPGRYAARELGIPESGNGVPDLLDEVMWNIDWMLTMQDPNDGGVYHKLTTLNFVGEVMPADTHEQRYVVQKGTAAALNFAAVMAVASRVVGAYETTYPGRAAEMLAAAERAWQWAQAHPDLPYRQPDDVKTGGYGDREFSDEFAWAAAEMFITTGDSRYWEAVDFAATGAAVPGWSQVSGLAWMSLARHAGELADAADTALIGNRIVELADAVMATGRQSAWGVPLEKSDFVWGSNSVVLNRAMMLLQAYDLAGNVDYLDGAQALLDWVLGRNPTGYSFVTGHGGKTPMHIHHRPSQADGVVDPVPGFVAGGPQPGQQDKCEYPSKMAAESYVDHWCSYSTNEITINWNAPMVYVTGVLESINAAR
ncbi:cellulase [Marinihelvus fidelis]|uniref:Endoglucanase n=1 Tax=Marinihelvus fidelis TaxID=2613842 RepID=A0A5N0TDB2_9GAMM|nr:glycoside hydrolase family 9 protein [Marinihelvus fidelis]KAA9132741.1 cellulase [Marinihelvus fidelis]